MFTRITHFFRAFFLAIAFAIPSITSAAGNTVVIGQAIDLSGPNGSLGRDYVAGIKTFFDALNAKGGLNGKHVHYIVRDDQGKPQATAAAVQELIEQNQVDYLFGGIGDESTIATLNIPAFKRSNHILFAPLAAGDFKNNNRVLFWRPSYKQEIRYIFTHFSKLGIKEVGIAYQESSANQEAYQDLIAEIKERGLHLTGTAYINGSAHKNATEAARLVNTKPGVVVLIADTIGAGLFLKEFRKYGPQTFVAGTSLVNLSTLHELAGASALEWTVFSQVVPNPGGGTSLIQIEHQTMMKKYRDESASSMTLEGFAAAKALTKAIQQSKKAPRLALQELIANNSGIDLGGISITYSPNHNRLSSYVDIALFRKGSGLVFLVGS